MQTVAQDTIKTNLINTNTAQSLSTANPPVFRVFSKNTSNKSWIILENIRHQQRLEWLWTIEIRDEAGNIFIKKADWSIINDDVMSMETKVIAAQPNHYINAEISLSSYLEDFMFESWGYYHFLPGKYQIRFTYQLPSPAIEKIEAIFPNRNYKTTKLTTIPIQTNWLEIEITESPIHFPTDFQNVTFKKVNNPHLNWIKQLTVIQNNKHIKEQLFDWNNHLIAEFVPDEPTDSATYINLYAGKQFEIKNNTVVSGKFQQYFATQSGIEHSEVREVLRSKGNIKKGRLDNVIYVYNSRPHYSERQINYRQGLPNGKFKQWQATDNSETLILREKGFYKDSLRHRTYVEYYENGEKLRSVRYKKGLVNGKVKTYHKTGNVAFVEQYKSKIKDESSLKENRLLAGKLYHDAQIKHGAFISFDTLGQINQKRRFRNDALVGKHFQKIMLDNQTYTVVGFYKNGQPWKGQFIYYQSQTTRGRYGVERSYTVYRTTYDKGIILNNETLKKGEGWLIQGN